MALPTNTTQTYDLVGIKESFENIIFNIAPTDTPFLSMLPRKSIDAVHHEWQTDTLATAANNKHIEGYDTDADDIVPTVLADNYCQISKKIIQTSGTSDAVAKYGRGKSEKNYQEAKAGKELKRDMEFALCQNGAAVVGAAATARQTRGLEGWIETNDLLGSGGTSPDAGPGAGTAPVDGTQRAFTETLLRQAQQEAWEEGGDPKILMVGAFNRGVLDSFSGFSTRMQEAGSKKLVATVEVYQGPFGSLKVLCNRHQRDRTAFVLDKEYWSLGVLRGIRKEELSKTGDSERAHILAEYCLISKQEKASAAVRDLTTS
jgi:hypothetical protein